MNTVMWKKMVENVINKVAEGFPPNEERGFLDCCRQHFISADENTLKRVIFSFFYWLLVNETNGIIRFAEEADKRYIRVVAMFFQRELKGESVTIKEWCEAADVVVGATGAASWAPTAAAKTVNAIASAEWVTNWMPMAWKTGVEVGAAREAVRCAREAVRCAREAAGAAFFKTMAAKLLELLQEAQKPAPTA